MERKLFAQDAPKLINQIQDCLSLIGGQGTERIAIVIDATDKRNTNGLAILTLGVRSRDGSIAPFLERSVCLYIEVVSNVLPTTFLDVEVTTPLNIILGQPAGRRMMQDDFVEVPVGLTS